jgi:hypothetical protein
MFSKSVLFTGLFAASCALSAQTPSSPIPPASAAQIPGKGIAEHDFMYAGESQRRRIFIVREGKVVWTYKDLSGKGEISDAVMLSNGNILFAHQFGVTEITPEKKVVWNYDALAGHEVHTAVPIGKERVLYIQNGRSSGDSGCQYCHRCYGTRDHFADQASRQHAWPVSSCAADGERHPNGGTHGSEQGGGI